MDVLSSVLEKIQLKSAVYFKSDFTAPWGMNVPTGSFAQFHIVVNGRCLLNLDDEILDLSQGDLVVFPHGSGHWLADQASSERENGRAVVNAIWEGRPIFSGKEVCTTLICGHFEFDRNISHSFLHELPFLIHIKSSDYEGGNLLGKVYPMLVEESENTYSGSELIVRKLGEILFIHILRIYIENKNPKEGFLAALKDKRISKALKVIHQQPERSWQLESLAQAAGMSRTGFCTHFKAILGKTPYTYLTDWRMLQAQLLLRDGEKPIGEIAEMVGYQSEAAFNRAFKKRIKKTPLKFRQQQ